MLSFFCFQFAMNIFRNIFRRDVTGSISSRKLPQPLSSFKNYHTLFKAMDMNNQKQLNYNIYSSLLSPAAILSIPVCGFKFKGVVERRCKDCYIVVKDRQKIVLCKTHPRHKQKEIVPAEKDTWIITQRTRSRIRPW